MTNAFRPRRTQRSTIPPLAFRTGDFSAASTKIYDPMTGNPDGTGRLAFPNNNINQIYDPASTSGSFAAQGAARSHSR